MIRPWALAASCVLFGLAPMARAEAQTVEGRVWDAQSDRTLANAVLRLVDTDGDSRAATTADSTGHYRISVPGPGRYRVQAEHLGYRPYQSGELTFEDGQQVRSLVIEMQPAPVPVRGLEVSAEQADRKLRGFLGRIPRCSASGALQHAPDLRGAG